MKALTVTAAIVLSALLLCVAWLAFFPGGSADQVVTVSVSPPPPKPPAPPPPAPSAGPQIDLPPGFGIAPSRPQSAPGGTPAAQQQQAANQPQSGAQPAPQRSDPQQTAAVPPPPLPPPPESETASITLVQVPVAELVEDSQYGPL